MLPQMLTRQVLRSILKPQNDELDKKKVKLNKPQVFLTTALPDHLSLSSLLLYLSNNLPIKSSEALQAWFQSSGCTILQNAQCCKKTKGNLIKV